MTDQTTRPLHVIAADVRRNWAEVNYAAVPYLEAMARLSKLTDRYGEDDGTTVVRYFLSNTRTWSGPEAHRIKNELRAMVGLPLAKAPKATTAKAARPVIDQDDTSGGRAERKIQAAVVKTAVMRAIFCPYTGDILDMRRAVVVVAGGASRVMTGLVWDQVKDEFFAQLRPDQAATVKVYDGRELYTPSGRVR